MSDFDFGKLFVNPDEKKETAREERALVFVLHDAARCEPARSLFITGHGVGIESDLDAGLDRDEIGPTVEAPKEPGLWIWEGTPLWHEERSEGILEGVVPEYHNRGAWRRPTVEEAARLATGDLAQFTAPPCEETPA